MSKVIAFSGADRLSSPEQAKNRKRNPQGLTTADYRRLLSELKLRPPTQRAFLRKLLNRSLATVAAKQFPVTNRAVRNPVGPS